jgi:hypothetical protein
MEETKFVQLLIELSKELVGKDEKDILFLLRKYFNPFPQNPIDNFL